MLSSSVLHLRHYVFTYIIFVNFLWTQKTIAVCATISFVITQANLVFRCNPEQETNTINEPTTPVDSGTYKSIASDKYATGYSSGAKTNYAVSNNYVHGSQNSGKCDLKLSQPFNLMHIFSPSGRLCELQRPIPRSKWQHPRLQTRFFSACCGRCSLRSTSVCCFPPNVHYFTRRLRQHLHQ